MFRFILLKPSSFHLSEFNYKLLTEEFTFFLSEKDGFLD